MLECVQFVSPELLAGIFGLVGVLIGGAITFCGQLYFLRKEQKDSTKNHVSSAIHKYRKICDQIYVVARNIFQMLPEGDDQGI